MPQNPIPQGNYRPAVRRGDFIYTAGMTPRKDGGLLLSGPVTTDCPLEGYRKAVVQAASNALTAAKNTLREGERIGQILSLTVYVNAVPGFTAHSKIGDMASDWLYEQLGEAGVGARAAVGVAGLPGDAPVEIQLMEAAEQEPCN